MQHTHYRRKHPRDSSPHQEMKQRLDDWVRGILPIEQPAEDSSTSHRESNLLQPVDQRVDPRRELISQEPGPDWQWDKAGRWI